MSIKTENNGIIRLAGVALIGIGLATITGCEEEAPPPAPAAADALDDAGDAIEDGMDDAGDAIDDAVDEPTVP